MKKVKTFEEYESLTHRVMEYPANKTIEYLANELLRQAEELAKEAKGITTYSKDVRYEAMQEKLGDLLLCLTELSKYAVYLNDDTHTPNSALEYIACKSLNKPFIKMEEMR